MAKLYFKYGAMGSSKSAQALITQFNYEELGMTVWLIKPSVDDRDGANIIRSRIGLQREAQVIHPDEDIIATFARAGHADVIIADEAQFFSPEQIDQLRRIVAAQNYLAAYANVRQLSFGMTDMAWHTLTEPFEGDVEQFEAVSMAPTQVLPVVPGTAMAPAFGHIFSGGYAAGYYGYKWAEVLEADAFSLFKEKGIFNREAASSFRENVLAKGGTEHPMELYVRFRGHKPETRALIEKMGLGK